MGHWSEACWSEVLGTTNTYMSTQIILPKSCHPELGASRRTIWYLHLCAYSSSLLALSLSQLFPCTCYIVDCKSSWLFISLLYLQLVDYILYLEILYINNRCTTCCASFPSNTRHVWSEAWADLVQGSEWKWPIG